MLQARIIDLAHARRRFGYRRIHDLLRREGVQANHKKVYRLYREAALSVRKRRRRKAVMVDRQALQVPSGPNEIWSIDFVMDALANGRRIKCLTIVDDFTRECLDIAVDYGISGGYVARVLEAIGQFRGLPRAIRVSAGVILIHFVGVKLTHLGEHGGFWAADDVDPGASSGDQGAGPSRCGDSGDRATTGLLTQYGEAVSA
jgi:transposase InsO family protein